MSNDILNSLLKVLTFFLDFSFFKNLNNFCLSINSFFLGEILFGQKTQLALQQLVNSISIVYGEKPSNLLTHWIFFI